ncbi:ORF6C domain-containing protein [uncultured Anaerococcus sp.]|uniref:ORF6C domain-containing protein n=1 Tax=uncultured Anaerococcus sp. TaxID=293428 RepID=UPI00260AC341|nr:ORF6C domain-containing protein [uncultured Anaerococcus sp.]
MTEINNRQNKSVNNPMILNNNLENVSLEDAIKVLVMTQNQMGVTIQDTAARMAVQEQKMAKVESDVRDLKEEVRIEAFEDKIIRNKVKAIVKTVLGGDYDNQSKRNIAYAWGYEAIKGIGYKAAGSTKRRDYKHILQAIDDGVIDFTHEKVNERYRKIKEVKES